MIPKRILDKAVKASLIDFQFLLKIITVLILKFWDLQEPLVELANPSDTDIDIPANFD